MQTTFFQKTKENPWHIFHTLALHGLLEWMSDEIYLKTVYRGIFGERLSLSNPKRFNEKLQWLKLYDRKEIYTKMVDKYESKIYVAEQIGEKYIIPTIGIWNTFDEIDFDKLPD